MSLNAEARLILVRVKIERAKKHLKDLESELLIHTDHQLDVVIGDAYSQPGHNFFQMSELPTQRLPVLPWNAVSSAGDVIHNLRSALDHLAYQLVIVGTPGREPSRQVEFPIAKDLATYNSTKAKKLEGNAAKRRDNH